MRNQVGLISFCMLLTFFIPMALTSATFYGILFDIRESEHTFVRNGMHYDGNMAYRWFKFKIMHKQFRGNPIKTRCDFIKRVATRSNKTSQLYGLIDENGKWHWLGRWLEHKYGLTC